MTDVRVTFTLNCFQTIFASSKRAFVNARFQNACRKSTVYIIDQLMLFGVKASACKYPVWFAVIGAANMALRFHFGRNMVFVSFRCDFC